VGNAGVAEAVLDVSVNLLPRRPTVEMHVRSRETERERAVRRNVLRGRCPYAYARFCTRFVIAIRPLVIKLGPSGFPSVMPRRQLST
jgi:hypothetical protein